MKHGKDNKKIKIIIAVIVILILAGGATFAAWMIMNQNNKEEVVANAEPQPTPTIKPEVKEDPVKIFAGQDRPIACMIDNHKDAWPQAGLNKAYCVYEIIVEGGESRLMALFKGVDVDQIGPVRSSRHYFLDYALENDAIYVHYGWSPQAEYDISALKVKNIKGITESSSNFWRIKAKSSPHNVITSTESIKKMAESKKYATTSNAESVLHYVTKEVNLNSEILANTVTIPYSTTHTVSYQYDEAQKRYIRFARGKKQTDFVTNEDVTTKNIIITFAENYTLNDSENKGRQGLKNIGVKDGYYITNGKAIKIKCQKDSREGKTVYKDLDGKVIDVNDGNTFINICPFDSEVIFE